jgi:aryl-alcohol dehydrogenase-like predicted oxidoreductase
MKRGQLVKTKKVPAMPDLEFSAVGFGCWGISGGDVWNNTTDENSIAAVQRALDLGVNFFDVAPVYGFGHAEEVLGRALTGRRQDVIIGSKCGLVWDDQKNITNDLTAANVRREIDDSLRRLQTDYIDVYQLHWPDPATPIEETMAALLKIQAAGKIRYIGVSNFSLGLMQQAMATGAVASYQGLYNLLERNPDSYHNIPLAYRVEDEILPFCREQGLAFFPYSPLFQGLLTDGFKATDNFDENDARAANPKLVGETFNTYFAVSEKLREFAREIGKPLSQIAINWLINQAAVTSVICGAQTPQHVEENVGSTRWDLTDEMMDSIARILQPYRAAKLF